MGDEAKCLFFGCKENRDPRWGAFCDGHGVTTELEWRARAEQERTLMAIALSKAEARAEAAEQGRATAQAEVKHAYACMQVAEMACRKAEKERDANWQSWSHSNEDRQAAESRATQLARQVEMYRGFLLTIIKSPGRVVVPSTPEIETMWAALHPPQGAPKKEGP